MSYLILLQNPFDPVVYWLALWTNKRQVAGSKTAIVYTFSFILMRNLRFQSLMDSN